MRFALHVSCVFLVLQRFFFLTCSSVFRFSFYFLFVCFVSASLARPVDTDVQWTLESARGLVTIPLEKREPAMWPLLVVDDAPRAEMDPCVL